MNPEAIRAVRKRLGLSPDEFAERLGFAGKDRRVTVWRWERGKRKPSDQAVISMQQLIASSL